MEKNTYNRLAQRHNEVKHRYESHWKEGLICVVGVREQAVESDVQTEL